MHFPVIWMPVGPKSRVSIMLLIPESQKYPDPEVVPAMIDSLAHFGLFSDLTG